MANLGAPNFLKAIDYYEAGADRAERSRLRDLDERGRMLQGQALQGDQNALAQLGQINPQAYMQTSQFTTAQKKARLGEFLNSAYSAKTPEQWNAVVQRFKTQGHQFGPGEEAFENRENLIRQGMSVADQMGLDFRGQEAQRAQANADRSFGLQQQQVDIQRQKLAQGGGGPRRGLNPQYGVDAEGNPVIIQLGEDGTAVQTPLPEGVSLSKTPIKLDAGTHFVLLDPITRQPVGQIPKDLAGAEAQKVSGKGEGEAIDAYRSLSSKMPGLEHVVGELDKLSETATYTLGGQLIDTGMRQAGMEPRESAVARARYISIVDNQILPLLRDTFGAQFTQKEGESLKVTLGDPNKSPAEKQTVLRSFIEQKRRDVEALAVRAGQGGSNGGNPQPGGDADGWTPLPDGGRIREIK